MNHLEHVMKNIQLHTEVPEIVQTKLDDVLNHLPDHTEVIMPPKRHYSKGAVAAACALAVGTCVFYSNPALAAKLPLIGKIFSEVENEVSFSGNYSKKAETLNTDSTEQSPDPEQAAENSISEQVSASGITATDNGITVTASEIYCDGLSVFLTTQVTVESGGLSNLAQHYTGNGDTTAGTLYLKGEWNLDGTSDTRTLSNNNLEGKVVDDHTFIGILKLNLNDCDFENETLALRLSRIGWDDLTMLGNEDISASHHTEGLWTFHVPFHVDTQSTKEYTVNKTENGFTLKNVFVSPYQVVSYIEMPDETYPCTMICDQNGKPLEYTNPTDDPYGKTVFAVNGRDLTTLHLYVFDTFDAYLTTEDSMADSPNGCIDMDTAGKNAVVSADINIK